MEKDLGGEGQSPARDVWNRTGTSRWRIWHISCRNVSLRMHRNVGHDFRMPAVPRVDNLDFSIQEQYRIAPRRAKYHWHVHSTGKYFFSRRLIRVARSWIRLFRRISDIFIHFRGMKCDLSSGKTSNILVIDFIYSNYVETLQWEMN